MPCFALQSQFRGIAYQFVRPQDACFLAGYVLVPGQPASYDFFNISNPI